jgi:dihydrolipoamide dehydrogenase
MTDHTTSVDWPSSSLVGKNVADRVAHAGLSAAMIEQDLVGGECSYWACTPTKALG